ncbi:hypothetical protein CDR19_10610 [Ectopseudomonas toyotomiensis]|uniref:Methyltransferase domain-containing protein n=1 Tax=Ectopseudomonas toyotomiensis TaxID=554344 RepID=A0A1I5UK58_9GAMM|nr:class I SAM-dependent methyltransferase [Pseudomonas toyotomiensis]PIA73247.1 hypothetical protein CDR19_10610 [Pseudomonas toyotomiensis]SFP95691.1 Methyltransferase domain-containing protein [Pseudomonas toyotomiensis]
MTNRSNAEEGYRFTVDWFSSKKHIWDDIFRQLNPARFLEIGSFEGRSACYIIESVASQKDIELHCVDSWEGGIEHQPGGAAPMDMSVIEQNFLHNIELAASTVEHNVNLTLHKSMSDLALAKLVAEGWSGYFDMIYVDGSHQAPDVLSDAVLAFKLLKVGGVLIFDDYLWYENLPYGKDILRSPKLAIDSFVNINYRKMDVIRAPLGQLYLHKTRH